MAGRLAPSVHGREQLGRVMVVVAVVVIWRPIRYIVHTLATETLMSTRNEQHETVIIMAPKVRYTKCNLPADAAVVAAVCGSAVGGLQ